MDLTLFGFVSFILTIGFFNEFSFFLFISLTFGFVRPSVDIDSTNESDFV